MPVVSVIMPAFNAQRYIAAAIQSVLDQTFGDLELIVIDDGSMDETAAIAKKFANEDPRIKYRWQSNAKLACARNAGLLVANGNFLSFLDADDVWRRDKLQKQLDTLDHNKCDVVFSDAFDLNDPKANGDVPLFGKLSGSFSGTEMFRILYAGNKIAVSSVLVRRSEQPAWELKFDEDPAVRGVEDYELWLRLASNGASFFGVGEKLLGYRQHEGQMSRNVTSMMRSTIAARHKHFPTAEALGIDRSRQECIDLRDLAYCSCNEGRTDETWRSIATLCDLRRFGVSGIAAALGATLHALYHLLHKPSRSRG